MTDVGIDHLRSWMGRRRSVSDVITPQCLSVKAYATSKSQLSNAPLLKGFEPSALLKILAHMQCPPAEKPTAEDRSEHI